VHLRLVDVITVATSHSAHHLSVSTRSGLRIHLKLGALILIADSDVRSHIALDRAAQCMDAHIDCLDAILAVLLNVAVLEVYLSCLLFKWSIVSGCLSISSTKRIDTLVPVTSLNHCIFSRLNNCLGTVARCEIADVHEASLVIKQQALPRCSCLIDGALEDHAIRFVLIYLSILNRDSAVEANNTDSKSLIAHRGRVVQGNGTVVLNLT